MNKSKLTVLLFLMLALLGIFSISVSADSLDSAGTRISDEQMFRHNRPPQANAGPDATYTDSDNDGYEELLLDGSGSRDPDGRITSYEWKLGSTVIATGRKPVVSLPIGVHTITLRVRDNNGGTGVDTVVITVQGAACTIGSMNVSGISNGQMLTGVVNVQALFSGTPTKVEFKLRGPNGSTYTHIENSAPFYFLGDTSGVPNGWNTAIYPAGSYRLTIISYEGSRPCETQVFDVTIPPPPPPQCSHITINNVIYGTSSSEVINGTPGNDLIFAGNGSDIVHGNGGDDCILGENGHDDLYGDDGNDVILGGSGSDKMRGGNHNDTLYGGNDSDSMFGDDGEDTLWGGSGSDAAFGGPGNDYINGEDGSDAPLVGNGGDDTIYGGSGHDELYGDGYNGHSGADYGDNGAPGNDKLYGESGDDELYGGPKDDVLNGGKNDDQMFGEAGNDAITGAQNSDDFWGGPDIDVALDYTKPPDDICNAIEFGCPGFPPPSAPTANPDTYGVAAGSTLPSGAFNVLSNDTGGPPPTVVSFGGPAAGNAGDNPAGTSAPADALGGILTLNANGTFTYDATAAVVGTATYYYVIQNPVGSSTGQITIIVGTVPTAKPDTFLTPPNTTLNVPAGGLFADNGSGADDLGSPAATIVSFGGGTLGGSVTDNAAGATVNSGGHILKVNADGSFDYTPAPAFSGDFTFQYRLQNIIGFSDTTVTVKTQAPPVAVNDGVYKVLVGGTLTVTTSDPNDLLDNDNLGIPAATLTSFGGGDLGGAVTDNAAGASVSLAGGTLTVNADGSFSLATPTTPGSYTFQYRLTNIAGTSDATVTIEVQQAPDAKDDSFIVAVGVALNGDLTADNGSSADDLGFPTAALTSFGGGDLGGTVTDNAAGASVSLAGGTLTVNADGTFSLTGTTATGIFTFQYRLANAIPASDDATVTIEIRQLPVAVNDGIYKVLVGGTLTVTTSDPNDLLDNDTLGFPAATITHFGGGDLGGTVTSNAAGASVSLAGGTLTVNANGSFSLATPTTPGRYTFQYRLTNAAGTSDATVTIEVQQAPIANDDSFIASLGATFNGDLTADNGSGADNPGFPAFNQLQFGGGDLGGSVTDNTAPDSVSLAGGTLTVNADGTFSLTGTTATGIFTFQYRLSNAIPASDDATVTIEIRQLPVAVNDGVYKVLVGGTLTVATSDPNDLLDNDTLGFPAATITHFGGGDLGGVVTDNAAGASVSLAGGTLTVNADGSFSLATPTTPGSYTFQYRLTNAAGTSDATVTIEVQQAPTANDDGTYSVPTGGTLTITTSDPNDLLDNDNLGFPAAAITSFGGGSMGGAVTDNAAGTTVSPLPSQTDGSLTVNADGSFSFTSPTGYCGNFTFLYRLTNAAGFDDALVTINVLCVPPDAVDDSVVSNSAPGNSYHTALNTVLTIADGSGQDLDANDDLGIPPGAIVSFGAIQTVVQSGGSAGTFNAASGTVTTNAAGVTVSPIPGFSDGSLTVNANGSLSFTPPTNYTGLFRFQYRLQNVVGFDDATVTLAVGVRPNAANDTYTSTLVGNIHIDTTVSSNFSVLTNDSGDSIVVGLVSSPNGNMAFNPNGTFTFNPAAGFEGSASVTYSITNGFGAVNGTLTLPVSGMIWFVNAGAGGGGDGRFNAPFNCLVGAGCFSAVAADDPGDNIFLYEHATTYTAGLTLLNNQRLIGQDATVSLGGITSLTPPADSPALPAMNSANATRVTLTNVSGDGVTLGQNNSVHGLTIANTSGTDLIGTSFGTLSLDDVRLILSGRVMSLTTGTCNCQFDELRTSSSTTHGIFLDGVGGTLTSPTTAISDTTAAGILVQNSGGSRDFGSTTVSITAAQTSVLLHNNTGTNTFSSLGIFTNNSSGLVGTNNTGGITVTAATGSINATGGAAVDITTASGTTPINLNFASITTINSPVIGIRLDNVSGTGMNVTGAITLDMAPGAVENMLLRNSTATTLSFASASTVAINDRRATGILIDNVDSGMVQFGATTVNNPHLVAHAAVRGDGSSSAVSFASLNINQGAAGTGEQFQAGDPNLPDNTTPAGNGDGVHLNNMSGLVTINGGTIQNVADDGIDIRSSSGLTLNNVIIDGFNTNKTNGQAGIQATNVTGTHTLNTVTVQNFDLNPAPALCGGPEPCSNGNLVVIRATTGTSTFDVNNGTFEGRAGGGNNSASGTGFRVFQTSTANVTLDINGATIRDVWSFGVLFQASAGSGSSTLNVQNTLFTGTGPAGQNGLELFTQGSVGHTASFIISGNTFTDIAQSAGSVIRLNLNDNTSATSVSNAVNANTVTQTGTPLLTGINFEIGENVSVRSTVNNNTITGIQDNALSFFSDINWTGTANLTVIDNIFGTLASPVGQAGGAPSGQAVVIRGQNTGTINLLMDNTTSGKSIVNTTHPRRTVDIRSEGTGRVNATVTDLVMTNTGSSTMVFLAATTVNTATMCLDLQTSSANSGTGTFTLSNAGVAANYLWDNASSGTNSGTVSPPAAFTASATCPLP